MTRRIGLFLCALLVPSLVFAQGPREKHGDFSATGSLVLNTLGLATASIQVSGTFVGTVGFEISNDNTNWVAIACELPTASGAVGTTTGTGLWFCPVAGVAHLRARVAAYTSGTITIDMAAASGGRFLPTPMPMTITEAVTLSTETTVMNTVSAIIENLGPLFILGQGSAFSASSPVAGFTPAATATDVCVITGSASATIKVLDARITGTATAATSADFFLIKRSAANTGGTSAALTVVPHNADDASVAPTVLQYTANPTINGTVGVVQHSKVLLPIAGTVASDAANTNLLPPGAAIELNGIAQQLAINYNGAALPAGAAAWRCTFSWLEESNE